jgi:hypothetical protein
MPRKPIIVHLVHGTWPEGIWKAGKDACRRFFTGRGAERSASGSKCWFQNQHPFHAELKRLLIEQGFEPHIVELTWSGANSFDHRKSAAGVLAVLLKQLSPQARQVVIGHSHGGSIALQAVNLLDKEEVEVVTLATPFLRVERFASNQGLWGAFGLWWMSTVAVLFILWARRYGANTTGPLIFGASVGVGVVARFLAARGRWIDENVVKPHATQYRGPRIQCIRGIADEAGLAVNAGIVGTWVGRTLLTALGNLVDRTPDFLKIVSYVGLLAFMLAGMFVPRLHTEVLWVTGILIGLFGCAVFASLAQGALGGELMFAGLQFITAVESTPDADHDRLQVVTLDTLQDTTDGLRHGVYNHRECVPTIVEGIASRKYTPAQAAPPSSAPVS